MGSLTQYIAKKKNEMGDKIKKPTYWIEQIADIVIVALLFLAFIGKAPWTWGTWAVIAYLAWNVMLLIYRALKKVYAEVKSTKSERRKHR